jgi:hypothetical protein
MDDDAPHARHVLSEADPADEETVDVASGGETPPARARRSSGGSARRVPALIGAVMLVAAGLLFALLGMRGVVARIPATPPASVGQSPGTSGQPTSVPSPAGTASPPPPSLAPSTNPPAQTPSPLILYP